MLCCSIVLLCEGVSLPQPCPTAHTALCSFHHTLQDGNLTSEEVLRSLAIDGAVNDGLEQVDNRIFKVGSARRATPSGCGSCVTLRAGLRAAVRSQQASTNAMVKPVSSAVSILLTQTKLPASAGSKHGPTTLPRPPPQVFDANNNGMIDAKEWAKTLGDLGADGEAAKRCAGGSARGCVYLGCGGVERRRLFAAAARPGGEAAKRCAGRQARVQTGVHTGGSR